MILTTEQLRATITGTLEDARNIICTATARFNATVIDVLTPVGHVVDFRFCAKNLTPRLKALLEK